MRNRSSRNRSLVSTAACFAMAAWLAGASAGVLAQPRFKLTAVPLPVDGHDPGSTSALAVNRFGWTAANYGGTGGSGGYRCSKTECQWIPLEDCFRAPKSASGINDAGVVVGGNPFDYYGCTTHAYSFDGTTVTNLEGFKESLCRLKCDRPSFAHAINNLGQVVGWAQTVTGLSRAALWQDGAVQMLGTLGGAQSEGTAINEDGVVAGNAELANGLTHAFMYRDGEMRDLGTLGGLQSFAKGINHRRQVVGCSHVAGNAHQAAFVFDDGAMAPLPGLGDIESCANAINNRGWVVGRFHSAVDDQQHAFLFDGTTLIDLNDTLSAADRAEWLVDDALGINKQGQIAGSGIHKEFGVVRALLLTPRER